MSKIRVCAPCCREREGLRQGSQMMDCDALINRRHARHERWTGDDPRKGSSDIPASTLPSRPHSGQGNKSCFFSLVLAKHQLIKSLRPPFKQRGQQTPPQVIHELEIEISSAAEFLTQGHYFTTNQPNVWEDQLECVVNTIRTLNRNAGPKVDERR